MQLGNIKSILLELQNKGYNKYFTSYKIKCKKP